LGRGVGSGRGRTSTRGHNGQKQRNGINIPVLFEGGQTPMFKRIPKLRWTNRRNKLRYKYINLEKLQYFIDTGRIDPTSGTITLYTLKQCGMVNTIKWPGVKLLARGYENFTAKIDIEIPKASKSAIAAIEKAGGSIRSVYYNRRSLLLLLRPHKYPGLDYRNSMGMPPPKLFQYYMRSDVRGYLALGGYDRDGVNEHEKVPDVEEEAQRRKGERLAQDYLLKKKK
jgi:large subunit ribosomal protein L15